MMLSDIFYFLLLFLIFANSVSADCIPNRYETSVECHSSHNRCLVDKAEIKFLCYFQPNVTYEVDAVYGTANASFPLPPINCKHTSYAVQLFVHEKNVNELCPKEENAYRKHSVRCFDRWKCEGVDYKCEQYGKVAFRYIFSGCYRLKILPYIYDGTEPELVSEGSYIESNYTKYSVDQLKPKVASHYDYKERMYDIRMSYSQPISFLRFRLDHENGTSLDWAVVKAGIQDSRSCRKLKNITESTLMLFNEVDCMFHNVTPGNYILWSTLEDDRCVHDTIWINENFCTWKLPLVANQQPEDETPVTIISTIAFQLGLAIIIVILLLLAVLVYWLCKRGSSWDSKPGETPDEVLRPMMHKMKVLLLYPRDCKDFMNVMESFRKVLEKFHNVEVFDCYKNEEVLNGPLAWLQSLMGQPRLCTIIVTSHCAYLQQKALKSGHTTNSYSIYKEPTFLDTLFIFGLKLIMEDISPDIYRKNYVIGFSGFSENSNMLSLPTSFRRYIIPDHFGKLLSDMTVKNPDENFQVLHSSEYIALQNSVRTLKEYKFKNPHYLENLLNLV